MGSAERPRPSVLFNNPGPGGNILRVNEKRKDVFHMKMAHLFCHLKAYDPKKLPLEERSGYVFGKPPNSA